MRFTHAGMSTAFVIGLALTVSPLSATAATIEPVDVLIAETIHELPAPAVAMADDGRSLVAYQDAIPGDTSESCTSNGGSCSILAVIVEADGTTIGDPFLVSGDVRVNYYYAAPSVTWNGDRDEWLVLITSYSNGFESVFAQRVASDGTLIGGLQEMPTSLTTPADDRSTGAAVDLDLDDIVKASATWSSAHQAYLMTWYGDHLNSTPVSEEGSSVFGYFATSELESVDGLDASFIVSDGAAHYRNVEVAYSDDADEWVILWSQFSSNAQARAQTVTLSGDSFTVSPSIVVADPVELAYSQSQMAGGVAWLPESNGWLLSWAARPNDAPTWESFGRMLTEGVLGPVVQLSDFSALPDAREVRRMMSQELHYDAATGTIHAVATGDYDGSYNGHMALHWTLDPTTLEPTEATWVRPTTDTTATTSRIRITGEDGGIAVVYQHWPGGSYQDPAEVRYVLLTPATPSPLPPQVAPQIELSTTTVTPGDQLAVTGSGFTSNAPVRIELRSDPVALATVDSTADGTIDATVTIPQGTPAGEHEVRVIDVETGLFASATITVQPLLAATGAANTVPLASLGMLVLGLGAALAFASRRRATA